LVIHNIFTSIEEGGGKHYFTFYLWYFVSIWGEDNKGKTTFGLVQHTTINVVLFGTNVEKKKKLEALD
jgi:hypothetical protein